MKRHCVFFIGLISIMSLCIIQVKFTDASEDFWTQKASMQNARGGLGVAVANDKIYAIGGSTLSGLYPPDILGGFVGTNEQYDPAANTWNFKKSMPTPRFSFAIASYQNKIYCIGGAVGVNVDSNTHYSSYITSGVNEVYDIATDTWETKTSMPRAEMSLQAHVLNGKIYVIGEGLTYVYDPIADLWVLKTPMPASLPTSSGSHPVSVADDNNIYVIGEFSTGGIVSEPKTLIYDTEKDTWSQGKAAPSVVVNGAAGATTGANSNKRIYIFGASREQLTISVNLVYDPKADTWATGVSMPTNRMAQNVAVINELLYVIGGYNYSSPYSGYVTPTATNEQYTPIGYGSPDPFYTTPTPNPTLSPSSTPSPTEPPTPSPTQNTTSSPTVSPSPSIPEFSSSIILILMIVILASIMVFRKRTKNNNQYYSR